MATVEAVSSASPALAVRCRSRAFDDASILIDDQSDSAGPLLNQSPVSTRRSLHQQSKTPLAAPNTMVRRKLKFDELDMPLSQLSHELALIGSDQKKADEKVNVEQEIGVNRTRRPFHLKKVKRGTKGARPGGPGGVAKRGRPRKVQVSDSGLACCPETNVNEDKISQRISGAYRVPGRSSLFYECKLCSKLVPLKTFHVLQKHLNKVVFECPIEGCDFGSEYAPNSVKGHTKKRHGLSLRPINRTGEHVDQIRSFLDQCFPRP